MNITEFAMFKKMAGKGGGGGASAYTAKSIDELPSNAVDGSLALVGDDGFLGTWRLHPIASLAAFEHLAAPEAYHEFYGDFIVMATGEQGQGNQITHCKYLYFSYAENSVIASIGGANDDEGTDVELYVNQSRACSADFIIFETMPETEEIKTFIRANGTKTKTICARENGEWVYKGEVA